MKNSERQQSYDSNEICRMLQISKATLYKMIQSSEIEGKKDERGYWRINLESLEGIESYKGGYDMKNYPVELYTLDQCQEMLKLGRNSVLKLLNSGDLRGIKVKGMWRVSREEMERYLQERM